MSDKKPTVYAESKLIQQEIARLSQLIYHSHERIRLTHEALDVTKQKIRKAELTFF